MIFYFSATGNSLAAARRISNATGDGLVSIADSFKKNRYSFVPAEGERVGFVFPCYFYGVPPIVADFINKLDAAALAGRYIYVVITYGGGAGFALSEAKKLLQKQQIAVSAAFTLKMPDSYVILYKAPTKEQEARRLDEAGKALTGIVEQIERRSESKSGSVLDVLLSPYYKSAYAHYQASRKTEKFHLSGECAGCGKCSEVCPKSVITIKDGKPRWDGDCIQCLACLSRCPEGVIQYGSSTEKNGRYIHPELDM